MNEYVGVTFTPPRTFREVKRSYFLLSPDGKELQLPIISTALTTEDSPDGRVATAACIPRFIAKDRGIETASQENTTGDTMGRYDWFLLGVTMSLLNREDRKPWDSVWEAKKVAEQMMEVSDDQ